MLDSEISLIEKLEKDYQNNEYENGLKLIEENSSLINKKYYEITKYKIIFLFKINKLIDAFVIIKEELNVPYIPRDFEIFLKEMQKKIFYELHNSNDKKLTIDDLDNIDKLSNDQLSVVIPSLKNFNLYVLLDKIKTILLKKDITNLNKTLIIAILTDFKINENFNVLKDDEIISFNPVVLKDIRECDDFKYLAKKIEKCIDLPLNISQLVNRLTIMYLMDIYPKKLNNEEVDELFYATLDLVNKMYNMSTTSNNSIEKTLKNKDIIQEKLNKLLETI